MNRVVRHRRRLRHTVLPIAGAVCCAGLGSIGRAGAEPSGAFALAWSAPEGCPSQQQVQGEIARLLGGDVRLQDRTDLQAKVTVSRGALWSADLVTQHAGQTGRRSIEGPSCEAVADGIALIIALSIDAAVAASAQAPTVEKSPIPQSSRKRPLQILAGVHAQGRFGTLPRTDIGLGLGIGLAGLGWHTELRWTYGLRRDQVASLPSGASGRFNLIAGSLTGCVDVHRTDLAFGPCAVAEAGRVSANGSGTTAGFSRDVVWLALGGGAFASVALSKHLRTSLEVDALASVYRPDYVFDDTPGVVFKAPAVGGRALIEGSWLF